MVMLDIVKLRKIGAFQYLPLFPAQLNHVKSCCSELAERHLKVISYPR